MPLVLFAPGRYYIGGAQVAQVSNVYRRPSGVYAVRLVVPARHREIVGKGEIHLSTGTRTLAVAKAVACGLLADWRRKFLVMDGSGQMDLERVVAGSPLLSVGGTLTIERAAGAAGVEVSTLITYVVGGRLRLYARLVGVHGHLADAAEVDAELSAFGPPGHPRGPVLARYGPVTGLFRVADSLTVGATLQAGRPVALRVFPDMTSGFAFVADEPQSVSLQMLEVSTDEVEALRVLLSASVSAPQLALAKARSASAPVGTAAPAKASRAFSVALDAYMVDKERSCESDHARRIRAACRLFIDFNGDLPLVKIDRDKLRAYIETQLPTVPARMNRAPRSADGSIPASWPRISLNEQQDRATYLTAMFAWLDREGWIDDDPGRGLSALVFGGKTSAGKRDQDARDAFDADDLKRIFGAEWWVTGRGELTRAGTYRTFSPFYYWLPLLGLYTGARINELCQLHLADIRSTSRGVWFLDINAASADKHLKNANSQRLIPVHPELLRLGFIDWVENLRDCGFDRLFPELRHDKVKGYSKDPVKWFSRFLEGFGMVRDGRKAFHSFRHGFVSQCMNEHCFSEPVVSQITGHQRGQTVLMTTYRKDIVPDDLVKLIGSINFAMPDVAKFDPVAGMKALNDAIGRKASRGR